jgi:hypothetical protein
MSNRLARLISILLHPVLLPLYSVFLLALVPALQRQPLPFHAWLAYAGLFFGFTFVFPVGLVWLLRRWNFITSIEMAAKEQRSLPLMLTLTVYLALIYMVKDASLPVYLFFMLVVATAVMLAGLVISQFYLVSLHAMSWGAYTAALIYYTLKLWIGIPWLVCFFILLSGIVGFARLKLSAHKPGQVYAGFLAGAGIVAAMALAL